MEFMLHLRVGVRARSGWVWKPGHALGSAERGSGDGDGECAAPDKHGQGSRERRARWDGVVLVAAGGTQAVELDPIVRIAPARARHDMDVVVRPRFDI